VIDRWMEQGSRRACSPSALSGSENDAVVVVGRGRGRGGVVRVSELVEIRREEVKLVGDNRRKAGDDDRSAVGREGFGV
jgi:hypothetical protein